MLVLVLIFRLVLLMVLLTLAYKHLLMFCLSGFGFLAEVAVGVFDAPVDVPFSVR